MQFSLFGAAAIEPSRADLDGLLLAGGQWVRSMHGDVGDATDRDMSSDATHRDVSSDATARDASSDATDRDASSAGTDRGVSLSDLKDRGVADQATRPERSGPGERARLSVLVPAGWRVEALRDEFARRDLDGEVVDAEGGLVAVRTPFLAELVPAAQRWTRGALTAAPAGLVLSAGGLRLWAVAAGRTDEVGYLLGTPSLDHPVHRAGGAQLAAAGLAAVSIGERGGPGWRITGLKRVRRLAELLGEPPPGAGRAWPG